MNEKLKQKLLDIIGDIFAYFIVGYIIISWLLGILLIFYNFIIVPFAKFAFYTLSPKLNSAYSFAIIQTNQLNISPSEKAYYSSMYENIYNNTIQFYQSFTPIPIDELIKDELILVIPPTMLLLLVAYASKDNEKNDDNQQ